MSRDNSEINMNMRFVSLATHKERVNKCRSELFAISNYSIKNGFLALPVILEMQNITCQKGFKKKNCE